MKPTTPSNQESDRSESIMSEYELTATVSPTYLSKETEPALQPFPPEPLTLGGILDAAFQICRAHLGRLFVLAVAPWLVMELLTLLTAAVFGDLTVISQPIIGTYFSMYHLDMGFSPWSIVPIIIVTLGVSIFSYGALVNGLSQICTGQDLSIEDSYRIALKRLWKLVVLFIIFFLICCLSFAFVIALGVMLFFALSMLNVSGWWSAATWPLLALGPALLIPKFLLADEAVMIENKGCFEAIARSWSILKGKAAGPWPRSFYIRYVILMHVYVGVTLVVSMVFSPMNQFALHYAPDALRPAIAITGMFLAYCGGTIGGLYCSACDVIFFFDVRNRKEGLDLSLMAKRGHDQIGESNSA